MLGKKEETGLPDLRGDVGGRNSHFLLWGGSKRRQDVAQETLDHHRKISNTEQSMSLGCQITQWLCQLLIFKVRLPGVFHSRRLRGKKKHSGVEFSQALGWEDWGRTEFQGRGVGWWEHAHSWLQGLRPAWERSWSSVEAEPVFVREAMARKDTRSWSWAMHRQTPLMLVRSLFSVDCFLNLRATHFSMI